MAVVQNWYHQRNQLLADWLPFIDPNSTTKSCINIKR